MCELDGVVDQVEQDLADARRVAQQGGGRRIGQGQPQVQVLFQCARLKQRGHPLRQRCGREGDLFDGQFAGLDFGKVEDVVDDGKQTFRRAFQGRHVFALLSVERGFQQQSAHPQNAVHGGADFMADVGDEPRFGMRHLQGGFARRFLGGLGGAAFGHVAHDRLDHRPAFQLHCVHGDLGREHRAVLAPPLPVHHRMALAACLADRLHGVIVGAHAMGLERGAKLGNGAAEEGGNRVHAEQR